LGWPGDLPAATAGPSPPRLAGLHRIPDCQLDDLGVGPGAAPADSAWSRIGISGSYAPNWSEGPRIDEVGQQSQLALGTTRGEFYCSPLLHEAQTLTCVNIMSRADSLVRKFLRKVTTPHIELGDTRDFLHHRDGLRPRTGRDPRNSV